MKKFFIILFLNNFCNSDFTDQCLTVLRTGFNSLPKLVRGFSNILEKNTTFGVCFLASIYLQMKKKRSIPIIRVWENIKEKNEELETIVFFNLIKQSRNECLRNKFGSDNEYQKFRHIMQSIESIEDFRRILYPQLNREIGFKFDFRPELLGASVLEDAAVNEDICAVLQLKDEFENKSIPMNYKSILLYSRYIGHLIPNILELIWLLILGNKILLNL